MNGSGYVSPRYPEIPENYPGSSEDYYFTPLGSVTVTNGEVFRNLDGVPYYGLALTEDGLQMYTGADNEAVLAEQPVQTWSFYTSCPMLRNNEDLLPEEWDFADRRAFIVFLIAIRPRPFPVRITRPFRPPGRLPVRCIQDKASSGRQTAPLPSRSRPQPPAR